MDIAKYIGLFLLKNQFCYVHGLGNLELVKRPSAYDGKTLQSPSFEVLVTPGGSIDDNLANFIAVNEQISISKAANALRDFSMNSRKELAAGHEVSIPNIGKFIEEAGIIKFVTDNNFRFTPAGIPTIKNSKQLEDQNAKLAHKPSFPPPPKADSVNWTMVIIVVVLLIILGGGGFGVYYYMHHKNNQPAAKDTTLKSLPAGDTAHPPTDTSMVVSTATGEDTMRIISYKIVIGDYYSKDRAEKRLRNLQINGNHVELVQSDSTSYLIISNVSCRSVEVSRVMDSMQALFGYKSVRIYNP